MKPLAGWLTGLPILLLDGTGDLGRVRRLLPGAEMLTLPQVSAPHARLHLITGGFGAAAMAMPKRQAELVAFMTARTALADSALLVTHKAAAHAFVNAGFDLAVAHHGAIAGRDGHRGVRVQFVTAGRSLPPEAAAELAAAMTGEAVPVAERVRVTAPVQLRNGTVLMVERMGYADPRTQAAHDAVFFADIGQAVGRGRGILRTAATPLDSYVFASAAPPGMVFDSVQSWNDASPDCLDAMLQSAGVPDSPTHAAALYPRLFATVKAAEQRIGRAVARTRRLFTLPARMTTAEVIRWRVQQQAAAWRQNWTGDTYQRAGQGHAPAVIHAPIGATVLMRKALAAALGPMTWSNGAREVVPTCLKDSIRESGTTSRPSWVGDSPAIVGCAVPLVRHALWPPDG